jgi:hypothetical protein
MTLLQLNPTVPVRIEPFDGCRGGKGNALGWIDYLPEHDLLWIVALDDDSGEAEPWCVPNKHVRFPQNITYGRYKPRTDRMGVE